METKAIARSILISVLLIVTSAMAGGKITVAVLDFEGKNVSQENAEALTDLLRTELFNTGRFTVVERQKIQKIIEEQKFQMSGLTNTDQVTQIGRLLNVNKIMIGTITQLGNTHIINTRIVDVQSGQVELAEAIEGRGDEDMLTNMVTELALKISYKVGLEGSIIRIAGEILYIDLGSTDGVTADQVFSVIRPGEAVTDLEGRVIGTNNEVIGLITVTKANDHFSEAAVKKSSAAFRKGDKVRPGEEDVLKPAKKAPPKPKVKKEQIPSDQKRPDVPPVF